MYCGGPAAGVVPGKRLLIGFAGIFVCLLETQIVTLAVIERAVVDERRVRNAGEGDKKGDSAFQHRRRKGLSRWPNQDDFVDYSANSDSSSCSMTRKSEGVDNRWSPFFKSNRRTSP